MAMIAAWLSITEDNVAPALQEAGEKLDSAGGEVVLDFESVRRIDSRGLRAMAEFASLAEKNGVKVVLHGVSVDVYKVLKLVQLTPRFSFVS